MRDLDSWVWLECVFDGSASAEATALQETHENGGITSAIALAEIDGVLRREINGETADYTGSKNEYGSGAGRNETR